MNKLLATFAIAGTLLITGCATVAPMSPTTSTSSVDTT
ncbi:outer membrane murein-binding lipoprotein Lpp [Paraburkholderia caledonica]|uniref:Outer membrane murein-binding lipoprotein Lpp n=2 Tax=Burkholderiaceae TaxID=119060 RepID=A0ABU1L6F9_9BURK|nr:outer membrane murein-binding lipoprotein Lpp [Paraburkholderia caledonica]